MTTTRLLQSHPGRLLPAPPSPSHSPSPPSVHLLGSIWKEVEDGISDYGRLSLMGALCCCCCCSLSDAEKRIRDHCTNEPWTTSLSQKENIARNRLACQCLLLQSERESYILVVGSLGLNCNGKDIENNVHWFTLYYSLSQEKTSARLLSRPVLILLFYVAPKPTVLCCAILATRPPAPSTTIYSRVQTTMRPGRGKGLNRGFWWHIVLKNGLIGEYRTQWF